MIVSRRARASGAWNAVTGGVQTTDVTLQCDVRYYLKEKKNKNLNSPAEKVVRKYVNTLTADDNNSNYSQQGADHSR